MAIIGILFDIDALGGGFYGQAAYRLLFNVVGRPSIRGVDLYDGDTAETLHLPGAKAHCGHDRIYCIALESKDDAMIRHIAERLAASTEAGLAPPECRLLLDHATVKAEPLVFAGAIDAKGNLVSCDTPWIASAWRG